MENSIKAIKLHEAQSIKVNPQVKQEREQAIEDLLLQNYFVPLELKDSNQQLSWDLHLKIEDIHLAVELWANQANEKPSYRWELPLSLFKAIVKDYFIITQSYSQAFEQGEMNRLEAIDMGRRAVHNEGAQTLIDALEQKVDLDFNTARRLFTLICVLHLRVL